MDRSRHRVALLATVAGFGGAEKVVLSLLSNIDTENFDVMPLLFTRRDQCDNVFFRKLSEKGLTATLLYMDNYRFKYINPIADMIKTLRFLRCGEFDLIHTHGYRADVIGIAVARMTSLPVISTCHGFINIDTKVNLYNSLDRIFLRFADKIIAVSEGIMRDLISKGIAADKIEVIKNSVSALNGSGHIEKRATIRKSLCLSGNDFLIGYVGRLSREKGVRYLIEAISNINADKRTKAVIIGDGPEKEELTKLTKALNLNERIDFPGFQDDVEKWFPALDLFVLPSLTEGTPMALLEAMSFGIPVIATKVGGVPDIIEDGKTGILIESASSEELSKAISRLAEDPVLCKEMGRRAKELVRDRYNIRRWCRQIEDEYIKLLSTRRGH